MTSQHREVCVGLLEVYEDPLLEVLVEFLDFLAHTHMDTLPTILSFDQDIYWSPSTSSHDTAVINHCYLVVYTVQHDRHCVVLTLYVQHGQEFEGRLLNFQTVSEF